MSPRKMEGRRHSPSIPGLTVWRERDFNRVSSTLAKGCPTPHQPSQEFKPPTLLGPWKSWAETDQAAPPVCLPPAAYQSCWPGQGFAGRLVCNQAHLSSRERERHPRAGSDMNLCSVHRRSELTPLPSPSEVLIVTAERAAKLAGEQRTTERLCAAD